MDYFQRLCGKSWLETWELVIESPVRTILIALCVFVLSAFLTYKWKGWDEMRDLVFATSIVALSTITIFGMTFLAQLFVFTPRSLYRDKEKELKASRVEVHALENKLEHLHNDYIGAISIETVDCNMFDSSYFPQVTARRPVGMYTVKLINHLDRAVAYSVDSFEVDGRDQELKLSDLISANGTGSVRSSAIMESIPNGVLPSVINHTVSLEISYGPADGPSLRRSRRTMRLEIMTAEGRVNFTDAEKWDRPIQ